MIYIAYLLLLLVLLFLESKSKHKNIYRLIIPIIYACFIGFRGRRVGVDTDNYFEHYYEYGAFGCDFIEKGFDWINRFMYAQGFEAPAFLTVIALITLFFIYLSLKDKQGTDYTISALCFYLLTYAFLINGIRQGVACAIFIYSIKFIENRKFLPFLLCLISGSLFHLSILFLTPLYFINRQLSNFLYITLYGLSFGGLFLDFSHYIPNIQLFERDYSGYVDSINTESASYLGFIVTTTLYVLVLILMLKNNTFKKALVISNLVYIYFILRNVGFSLPIVIGRLAEYFAWTIFFIYPIILAKGQKPLVNSRVITIVILVIINLTIWVHGILSPVNMQLPYNFFWE